MSVSDGSDADDWSEEVLAILRVGPDESQLSFPSGALGFEGVRLPDDPPRAPTLTSMGSDVGERSRLGKFNGLGVLTDLPSRR